VRRCAPLCGNRRIPRSKVIDHANPVRLEGINRFHLRGRCDAFKPRGAAPRILVCLRHQAVFHRILVHIVQPCQEALFIRQFRFPEIMPDLAASRAVQSLDPCGRVLMEVRQEIPQRPKKPGFARGLCLRCARRKLGLSFHLRSLADALRRGL
jgi:hypothetical protein